MKTQSHRPKIQIKLRKDNPEGTWWEWRATNGARGYVPGTRSEASRAAIEQVRIAGLVL